MDALTTYRPEENLNENQRKFCERYVRTGNGTQSAIYAGYSRKSATKSASDLLKLPHVNAYLQQLRDDAVATGPGLQRYWLRIMMDDEAKLQDKLRASELLAKAVGVFDSDTSSTRPIEIIFNVPKSD